MRCFHRIAIAAALAAAGCDDGVGPGDAARDSATPRPHDAGPGDGGAADGDGHGGAGGAGGPDGGEEGTGLEPADPAACGDPIALHLLLAPQGWAHDGSTAGQASHGEGTCGGGAGDVVYQFVAARAGRFVFTVLGRGDDPDPLLYVRTACGAGGRELACNDDREDLVTLDSRLELRLDVNESVFPVVDGYVDDEIGAWRGRYRIEVANLDELDMGAP